METIIDSDTGRNLYPFSSTQQPSMQAQYTLNPGVYHYDSDVDDSDVDSRSSHVAGVQRESNVTHHLLEEGEEEVL